MESIEKLRERIKHHLIGCEQDWYVLADEIEREVAEKYMLLPVDADGVPIHVGDVLHTTEHDGHGNVNVDFIASGYTTEHSDGMGELMVMNDECTEFYVRNCRHVKPDPVKELLEEFADKIPFVWDGDKPKESWPYDSLMNEYAAKIREAVSASHVGERQ